MDSNPTEHKKITRILASTACRSDFDLLSPVYKRLADDDAFDFSLLVSGAHLSRRFGFTARHIRATGLPILAELDTLPDTDGHEGRPINAANLITMAMPHILGFRPDIMISVGDREDALAVCMAGIYLKVPVAHFFGGDYGRTRDVDGHIRHACSKLSMMHFVTMEEHKRRLMSLGEPVDRIHVVGNPALDAFRATPHMTREDVQRELGVQSGFDNPYAVMVHHPSYADPDIGAREARLILEELHRVGIRTFVGLPNTDAGARKILDVYAQYREVPGFTMYEGLERPLFVNLLRNAAVLIGNSSMGLLEAPSIPLPVVNVGERQRGRAAAANVMFVDADPEPVSAALKRALSNEFKDSLRGLVNPYGDGRTAERVAEILARGVDDDLRYKTEDPLELNPPR